MTSSAERRIAWHDLDLHDEAAVVAFVQAAWEHRPEEQVQQELLGELAETWSMGNQYLFHVGDRAGGFRLEPMPNPNGRMQVSFNLYGPLLEQFIARLGLDAIEPEAIPVTGSAAERDAVPLQTGVCRYYRDRLDLPGLKNRFIRQLAHHGQGATKVVWDPLAGTEFALSRGEGRQLGLDEDQLNAGFAGENDSLRLATGEPRIENVLLCNLTWGPAGVPLEQAEWVVEAKERSVADVRSRWKLDPADIPLAYEEADRRWYRGGASLQGTLVYQERDPDLAITYELWAPRSAQHPRGVHAVVVGQKVVNRRRNRDLVNPYRHGRVPYVGCRLLSNEGRPLAHTPAWDLFDPQAMVNKLVGQIMESCELVANPRTWIQQGEPIDAWMLTNQPGGVHRFKNRIPETITHSGPPSTLYAILDRWINVMRDILGVHEASSGKAPPSGRSGRYVLALQDADNTRMGPMLVAIRTWLQEVFRLLLCVLQQFATDARLIAIRGADNAWERRAFRGEQLTPGSDTSGPEAFNIQLRTSGAARSRAAQIELVTMLIQFGFYDPKNPDDRQAVLTMLELGDTGPSLDLQTRHRELQRRVHEILITGRYVAPEYYHRHDVRLEELRSFMNGPDFPHLSPEIRALFVRYERDTLKLRARLKLEQEAVVAEATAEFQQEQARLAARRKALAQVGDLQAAAGPGEAEAIAQLLARRGGNLAEFLTQANGAPPPVAA